ncbi:MAG: integrase [Gemmatimonadota bacterium]|nr:MAG: integrase [Gemmatimonadota bacterium]
MRKMREVLRLGLGAGLGCREIARSCQIARSTVYDYLKRAREAGLSGVAWESMDDAELESRLFPMRESARSRPEPDWSRVHQELRRKGVTRRLLWEEYKEAHPDGYQLTQFCERYRAFKRKLDATLRQTHKAGEKMFVDYAGHRVPIVDRKTGESWEAEIFVAVLGASNFTYVEAAPDQSLESWIGSHTRAVEYIGGVAEITVPDNLKSGVSRPCRYEPDVNPTYHDWSVHYGTVIVPARAQKPRDKAKVENAVLIAERWILARLRNHTFFSIEELNRLIRELLVTYNNQPFQKLDGSRRSWFESIDRPALRPLPQTRYELARWKKARVNIDYHVELERHYYSVPHSLVKEEVQVRYTSRTVEILFKGNRVASHKRSAAAGRHTTVPDHMPKSHREHLEWTPSRIIRWAEKTGDSTARVVRTILEARPHPEQGYRSCLGILRLGKRYSSERLEAASSRALALRSLNYKSVESILRNGLDRQPLSKSEPAQPVEHGNIRGNGYYR